MRKFSIRKAEENGIRELCMGGAFMDDQCFREKDVLEEDYSNPCFGGTLNINSVTEDFFNNPEFNIFFVVFDRGALFLKKEEFEAGLMTA